MQVYYSIEEWRAVRAALPTQLSLGFVPTMGHLHTGHLSLCTASQRENDLTMVSIYTNRTQFNNLEDYALYPRTLETDLALLEKHGIDYCLVPNEHDMYADEFRYRINEIAPNATMEDLHRPGYFTGVLTVVMKLFQLVKPNRSYFGEKDYQQYLLIRNMVNAFFMDTDVIACPTIRETSGLAYSSRNSRLNKQERLLADQFAHIFHQRTHSCEKIAQEIMSLGIGIDYIEDHQQRRYAAVKIGDIRLIDNYALV